MSINDTYKRLKNRRAIADYLWKQYLEVMTQIEVLEQNLKREKEQAGL